MTPGHNELLFKAAKDPVFRAAMNCLLAIEYGVDRHPEELARLTMLKMAEMMVKQIEIR